MEEENRNVQPLCACWKKSDVSGNFQLLASLEKVGLDVYRHINTGTMGAEELMNETYIIDCANNIQLSKRDFARQLDRNLISCPRCQCVIERAQNILKNVAINKEIKTLGLCARCLSRRKKSCKCNEVVKEFNTWKANLYLEKWLNEINKVLCDVENKDVLLKSTKTRSYTNFYDFMKSDLQDTKYPPMDILSKIKPKYASSTPGRSVNMESQNEISHEDTRTSKDQLFEFPASLYPKQQYLNDTERSQNVSSDDIREQMPFGEQGRIESDSKIQMMGKAGYGNETESPFENINSSRKHQVPFGEQATIRSLGRNPRENEERYRNETERPFENVDFSRKRQVPFGEQAIIRSLGRNPRENEERYRNETESPFENVDFSRKRQVPFGEQAIIRIHGRNPRENEEMYRNETERPFDNVDFSRKRQVPFGEQAIIRSLGRNPRENEERYRNETESPFENVDFSRKRQVPFGEQAIIKNLGRNPRENEERYRNETESPFENIDFSRKRQVPFGEQAIIRNLGRNPRENKERYRNEIESPFGNIDFSRKRQVPFGEQAIIRSLGRNPRENEERYRNETESPFENVDFSRKRQVPFREQAIIRSLGKNPRENEERYRNKIESPFENIDFSRKRQVPFGEQAIIRSVGKSSRENKERYRNETESSLKNIDFSRKGQAPFLDRTRMENSGQISRKEKEGYGSKTESHFENSEYLGKRQKDWKTPKEKRSVYDSESSQKHAMKELRKSYLDDNKYTNEKKHGRIHTDDGKESKYKKAKGIPFYEEQKLSNEVNIENSRKKHKNGGLIKEKRSVSNIELSQKHKIQQSTKKLPLDKYDKKQFDDDKLLENETVEETNTKPYDKKVKRTVKAREEDRSIKNDSEVKFTNKSLKRFTSRKAKDLFTGSDRNKSLNNILNTSRSVPDNVGMLKNKFYHDKRKSQVGLESNKFEKFFSTDSLPSLNSKINKLQNKSASENFISKKRGKGQHTKEVTKNLKVSSTAIVKMIADTKTEKMIRMEQLKQQKIENLLRLAEQNENEKKDEKNHKKGFEQTNKQETSEMKNRRKSKSSNRSTTKVADHGDSEMRARAKEQAKADSFFCNVLSKSKEEKSKVSRKRNKIGDRDITITEDGDKIDIIVPLERIKVDKKPSADDSILDLVKIRKENFTHEPEDNDMSNLIEKIHEDYLSNKQRHFKIAGSPSGMGLDHALWKPKREQYFVLGVKIEKIDSYLNNKNRLFLNFEQELFSGIHSLHNLESKMSKFDTSFNIAPSAKTSGYEEPNKLIPYEEIQSELISRQVFQYAVKKIKKETERLNLSDKKKIQMDDEMKFAKGDGDIDFLSDQTKLRKPYGVKNISVKSKQQNTQPSSSKFTFSYSPRQSFQKSERLSIPFDQIQIDEYTSDDEILELVTLTNLNSNPKPIGDIDMAPIIDYAHAKHLNKKYVQNREDEEESEADNLPQVKKDEKEAIVGSKINNKGQIILESIPEETAPIKNYAFESPLILAPNVSKATLPSSTSRRKQLVENPVKGITHYKLSDRDFIEKGWTQLPTEKIVRKMNVYRMRPADPEFNWFERNKYRKIVHYNSGEKLAEIDDDGHGRWFYKNGRLALNYDNAEELNAQQRIVIYSSGEPDEKAARPVTVLAMFDHLGNGVVFDHNGKIRLKYNQTEGVLLDRNIGPVSSWKWHSLNDPPVLEQVVIDTHLSIKDPNILKMAPHHDKIRIDNEEMLAIEYDNFIKEKSKKLAQTFKPYQIKMKTLKINKNFSLKVFDQASIYLIFRDGSTNLKLNVGMFLDHHEIIDRDTADLGDVLNSVERFPARSDSLQSIQKSVAHVQRVERMRQERRFRLTHHSSADNLLRGASRPLRPPFRTTSCNCNRGTLSPSTYCETRFI